ncbi:MAG TPA: choice-of-anchor A family protein [Oscillospiraceae bacterium]|nr:choice-of-anchor A family protein [Oscillospiraceae bacterium]
MRWNITISKRTISLALTAVIAFCCLLNTSTVSAATNAAPVATTVPDLSLGAAQGYNLVCFNNLENGSADILGKSFVGGKIDCPSGFTFGTNVAASDYGLVCASKNQGDFIAPNRSSNGKALVYKDIKIDNKAINTNTFTGGIEKWNDEVNLINLTGIDLTANASNEKLKQDGIAKQVSNFQQQMINKSNYLTGLTATGTWKLDSSKLNLTGDKADVNVFRISVNELNAASEIFVKIPEDSTAVIDVTGDGPKFKNSQIYYADSSGNFSSYGGSDEQRKLLWNFSGAYTLEFATSVHGSVLAPRADITVSHSGNFEGELIANSVDLKLSSGSYEGHDYPFIPPMTLTKTAKLVDWDKRTYDIKLSASKPEESKSVANFSTNLYKYNTTKISKNWAGKIGRVDARVINQSTIQKSINTKNQKNLYFGNDYSGLPNDGSYNKYWDSEYDNRTQIQGLVYPNIVQSQLTADNQLQFSGGYAQSDLFSENISQISDNSGKKYPDKTVYKNVSFPFHKDKDGNYSFDSGTILDNGTTQDLNGDNAKYNASSNIVTMSKGSYGFFPFDDPKQPQNHSYSFGMSMGIQFKIPSGGTISGKPMTFEFSGDDDVWVFVDGQLALDIGGIHRIRTGSIDFTTGKAVVDYTANLKSDGSVNGFNKNVTKYLYDGTNNNNNLRIDSKSTDYHTLKVFFMERGDGDSNFKMKFNLYQAKELESMADVKDYIDPRFEVVNDKNEVLKDGATIAGDGTLKIADGKAYVIWKDQDIRDDKNWNRTFRVMAKREFIGGNNITTNEANSGVYNSNGDFIQAFPQPTVNVKPIFYIGNDETTIFRGEVVPDSKQLQPYTLDKGNNHVTGDGMYCGKEQTGTFAYVWKDENGLKIPGAEAICSPGQHPDMDTHYTLSATFKPSDATAVSNANSTVGSTTNTAPPTDNTPVKDIAEGIYKVYVVSGELNIKKTIDDLYPAPTEVDAHQSFVFKIVRSDTINGPALDTFYEVITPSKDDMKKITGLKKGYYKITEETGTGSDAWRYSEGTGQNGTKATIDNDNANGTSLTDHIVFIGNKIDKPVDNKNYFGADGNNPSKCAANAATIEFNNYLTNRHWLGDTTVVVNNISNK